MSNKLLLAFVAMTLTGSALAGATISELSNLNSQLKLQELQNKLDEAKTKHTPAIPGPAGGLPPLTPSAATAAAPAVAPAPVAPLAGVAGETEDIRLMAIYGVGSDLKAEVLYNGNTFTLTQGAGNTRLGSWTVRSITPYRLILTKPAKRVKHGHAQDTQKEVFLSSNSTIEGNAHNLNLYTAPGNSGIPSLPMPPSNPFTPGKF